MNTKNIICNVCDHAFDNCTCLDCDCFLWAKQLHNNPEHLTNALLALDGVVAVSYEFPGFWAINTTRGLYDLGDAGGSIGWNNYDGENGKTGETTPAEIARAFGKWMEGN